MSTSWADLLADIRYELDDESETSPEWSDKALFRWLGDALSDYSIYNPVIKTVDLSLNEASASYALPVDYLGCCHVQAPRGTFLHRRRSRPGVLFKTVSAATHFEIVGNTLFLNAEAEETILTYKAIHAKPEAIADADHEFTFPDRDAELIRLYICAKAYSHMRARQSSLDRFKLGSGSREDNPLEPEVEDLMVEYERKINQRYGGGVRMLTL